MAGCTKCSDELMGDDLEARIICDRCGSRFCQACSGLTSTEIRCMKLCKRTLNFFCKSCEGLGLDMVEKILAVLMPALDSKFEAMKVETDARFSSLDQKLTEIAEGSGGNLEPVKSGPDNSLAGPSHRLDPSEDKSVVLNPLPSAEGKSLVSPRKQSRGKTLRSKEVADAHGPGTNGVSGRRDFIRGTQPTPVVAAGSRQDTFAAVARRAHVYVGNVNPNASKGNVMDYIRERIPGAIFGLEELPKRDDALSRAYKLTIDFGLLEAVRKADFWPEGVIVKRFFQPKRR